MPHRVRTILGTLTVPLVVASLLTVICLATASAALGKGSARAEIPAPVQDMMTLRCTWGASTFMEAGLESIKSETDKGSGSLTFAVIDGQLTTIGQAGGEKLKLLGSAPVSGAMFFAEVTPIGNFILWSFYRLNDRRVLFIKQNNYAPKLTAVDGVHIYSHAGYCDVTGGNGRAISK